MKIAIFVEGHTEETLVEDLILAICDPGSVTIEVRRPSSGGLITISVSPVAGVVTKFVLLVNCSSDSGVLSRIRDQYESLANSGYDKIIGLRDVYPEPQGTVPQLIANVQRLLPVGKVPVSMHFALREVESWFLQEATHFERIDALLTPAVVAAVGFDPFDPNSNAELIDHPAKHLRNVYRKAGKGYSKKASHRNRTIKALSLEELYFNVRLKLPSLNSFLTDVEDGLFPVTP